MGKGHSHHCTNVHPQVDLANVTSRLEARVGKLALTGRFHRLPRCIEDDYLIGNDVLGSGYNGEVRRAKSKASNAGDQQYAVKVFSLSHVTFDNKVQLENEVECFLAMDHPHIARLLDVYETPERLHLVMECCEGGELFDRLQEVVRFVESDAAEAVVQMLLALNYLHKHDIAHRDVKLENFLYDKPRSNHLKLIDFGFSKIWDPHIKMRASCGTLSYVAPEVVTGDLYTSQCDLWSLGVIAFTLIGGYMPFYGRQEAQIDQIARGIYVFKPERWDKVSAQAKDFVKALLVVDPEARLTAERALAHEWLRARQEQQDEAHEPDTSILEALRNFGTASRFRRCCMQMMAWTLSNEEREQVREYFISIDTDKNGTITLNELRKALEDKFEIPDEETRRVFESLDSCRHEEIHYSDFLAAMVSTRIRLHDRLLHAAFDKFDTDHSGYITRENLREVVGDEEDVSALLEEADALEDGKISYAVFASYLRGDPLPRHEAIADALIDQEVAMSPKSLDCGTPSRHLKPKPHPGDQPCDQSRATFFLEPIQTDSGGCACPPDEGTRTCCAVL